MTFFVWVECVHKDARVDCVPKRYPAPCSTQASRSSLGGHLSPHVRQDTNTTCARREATFEPSARPHERLPRRRRVDSFGGVRRLAFAVDRQYHADRPSAMSQEVRRASLPHLAQDARGVGFQFSNPDTPSAALAPGCTCYVVPHVTTLIHGPSLVKAGVAGRCPSPKLHRRDVCGDLCPGCCPFLALSVQQGAANGSKGRHKAKAESRSILAATGPDPATSGIPPQTAARQYGCQILSRETCLTLLSWVTRSR